MWKKEVFVILDRTKLVLDLFILNWMQKEQKKNPQTLKILLNQQLY